MGITNNLNTYDHYCMKSSIIRNLAKSGMLAWEANCMKVGCKINHTVRQKFIISSSCVDM